jgi:DNA-binding NarL/FixJ family response regulator
MRCVIVDDSEDFLASATRLLESQGMQVIGRASSGEEALALTDELAPDVVLVDIMLGEEDGIGLARQLAEHEHRRRVSC